MKKLIVCAAVAMLAVATQAASIYWQYSSSSNEKNYHIYALVGETLPTAINNVSDWLKTQTVVGDKAVSYNTMSKKSTAQLEATNETITKDKTYYFVMVDAAGENFKAIGTYAGTDIVYDTANQESQITMNTSPAFAAASWTAVGGGSGGGEGVPEPTSGLLLLVGGAMLALRRKQK